MIGKLAVFGAVVLGLGVLVLCCFAMIDQIPPSIEAGQRLSVDVVNGVQPPALVHPNLVTAIVVLGSLAGLTVVFFVFLMQPKAGRSFASRRRQASSELVGRALDSLRGE